jgi:hypothetical protein
MRNAQLDVAQSSGKVSEAMIASGNPATTGLLRGDLFYASMQARVRRPL